MRHTVKNSNFHRLEDWAPATNRALGDGLDELQVAAGFRSWTGTVCLPSGGCGRGLV